MGRGLEKTFLKMANRYMKKCSTLLIIHPRNANQLIPVRTIPVKTAIIKKRRGKYWEECRKQ